MATWSTIEFRAMGNACRIVAPTADLARRGRELVDDLERRWSRFLPGSEISHLNATAGDLTVVSEPTFRLLERAEHARGATSGAYNPFVLDRLEELGYDRPWGESPPDSAAPAPVPAAPICTAPIELFDTICAVRLPPGARVDPGGIGKGLAGDLVAEHLRRLGASSAQIELGGDVRVLGPSWGGGEWHIDVTPSGDAPAARITIAEGGVATSGVTRRRWTRGGRTLHHLLDPRTGWPADTDLAMVTASASTLWWAEVVAKVAVMAGSAGAEAVLREHGASGVLLCTEAAA
jgi:thiamine biosynthesis lipoprotein